MGYELNPPFSFFLKNGSNTMFEDHPLGATQGDVFEQLIRFTAPQEFLDLLKLLDSLPEFSKLKKAA